MKKNKTIPIATVLTIVVGFIFIHLVFAWKWALQIAFFVGLAGVFSDFLAKKIDFLWMKLAWVLSKIMPNILLSIVFYLFLFPIALLSRIFGDKNPLNLKNDKQSLFIDRNLTYDKKSMEKMW